MGIFGKPNIEKMKEKRDVKGLIKAFRNKSVRDSATDALLDIGEEAVEPLIKACRGYSAKNLSYYASVLVRIGEPAVEPLMEAIRRNRSRIRDVRRQAAMALGEIGDRRAVRLLCWARQKEPTMTGAREFLIPALYKIINPPYKTLLEALEDDDKDTRLGAMDTLVEIAREQKLDVNAVRTLSKALQDKKTTMRQLAAYALGYIYDEQVISPLQMALEDNSWFVRNAAKESLKRVQNELKVKK